MLVNGQTGKVVGAVPFDKAKLVSMFVVLAVISSIIFTILANFLFGGFVDLDGESTGDLIAIIGAVGFFFYATGIGAFRSVTKNIALTKASRTAKFVRERQDDN